MPPRTQPPFRPTITELERRDVPSVAAPILSNSILIVQANSAATTVLVSQTATTITVKDQIANHAWSYSPTRVSQIEVIGGNGLDTFTAQATNPATARLVRFIGGKGNDFFVGNSGPVSMQAGSGTDTLIAHAGNDTLIGGAGTDTLQGGSGNTLIEAGSGDDYLNGGTGMSTLVGGIGNDTIIGINGSASDVIQTGLGFEVIWADLIDGTLTDTIIGSTTDDVVQEVPGFSNPGATTTLNGGTFTEPKVLPGNSSEAFAGRPLFAPGGPSVLDVKQYVNPAGGGVNGTGTTLDDSWLLSALGSIAQEDPAAIQANVVNFDDGTYGVKLGTEFFRVDNVLPVTMPGEVFAGYASVGQSNSLWVPIVEKAAAYYFSNSNTPKYSVLEAANGGTAPLVYEAFGAQQFGSIALNGVGGFSSAASLGTTLGELLANNYSTSINLTAAVTGTDADTGVAVTLVANREYTVVSVDTDIYGNVNSVILRDPSGVNPDGVEVSLANLYAASGTLNYGFV